MIPKSYARIGLDVDGRTIRVGYRRHRSKDGYIHEFFYKGQAYHGTELHKSEAKVIKVIRESL